jgi:hypothetical protein
VSGITCRREFEAAKRLVETPGVEEQVAERQLSARAAGIEPRSAVKAPTRSPSATSATPSECHASASLAFIRKVYEQRSTAPRALEKTEMGIVMPTS